MTFQIIFMLLVQNVSPSCERPFHSICTRRLSPLVVGDVQVSVDGEEGLLQEAHPLPLLLLRLLEDGLHLLHVAGREGRHVLQDFLVVFFALRRRHKSSFMTGLRNNTTDKVPPSCFFFVLVFTARDLGCISYLKLSMHRSINTEQSNHHTCPYKGSVWDRHPRLGPMFTGSESPTE